MTACADPTTVLPRLEGLEAFQAEATGAVSSLVDSLVSLKRDDLEAMQRRVEALEKQLATERGLRELDRCTLDLERTSHMHPKSRSVVFVGTYYFGDNVKYAFRAYRAHAAREGIDCWFLPQSASQEALMSELGAPCLPHRWQDWTAAHQTAALSAAVVVTSDHLLNPNPFAPALLAGARHVQLWHGVSIKEIGLRNLPPLKHMSPQVSRVLATCGPFARLVGTAAAGEDEWRRWFAFGRYAPIGYPRNDVLYRTPDAQDLLNVDLEVHDLMKRTRAEGGRVWFYAPTWRDANRGRWLIEAGIGRLAGELRRRGDLLVVNMHPAEHPHLPELKGALPAVRFVAAGSDAYPLMRHTNALITDYSSVMFDYLHLDRPIVLFRPDHADYTARSRRLFDDKLSALPGPLVDRAEALLTLLAGDALDTPEHASVRARLLAQWYDHHDGDSAQRLVKVIDEELDQALARALA